MTPLIIAALMLASALLGGVLRNPLGALFSRNPGKHTARALRQVTA